MRPLRDHDTIQIEITNACPNRCSNCTRLVGHHAKPYFMDYDTFTEAVDSLLEFPRMIGMMGGEPLIHPEFSKFCAYMREKVPRNRAGLWTSLPKGYEHLREDIVNTFGHIFINDHTRGDVLHTPILIAAGKHFYETSDMWYCIDHCWVQNSWSAAINPNGAYFCEIAAALGILYDNMGWKPEKYWWKKNPIDYIDQMRVACTQCGAAIPLEKRYSIDGRDDIDEYHYSKLKDSSPKIKNGMYHMHSVLQLVQDQRPTATYKEFDYRNGVAQRYGMFLIENTLGFCTPYLMESWKPEGGKDGETEARPVA